MLSLRAAVTSAGDILERAGVENAKREASLLLTYVLNDDVGLLYREPERPLTIDEKSTFDGLVARRAAREPLSHLTGHREFWSLDFFVNADVLDPRADSETLIDVVVDARKDGFLPRRIVDLGTGSGCLLLALLSEIPEATGVGIDVSDAALAVARKNADRLDLASRAAFQMGNWGNGLSEKFDLVISNPPYIPEADVVNLQPEVREFEPYMALAGGEDGLDCYRAILNGIHHILRAGGLAVFEVGQGQASDVARMMQKSGFETPQIREDLAGIQRCVSAILAS